MPFDRELARRCLKAFDLKTLFIDALGWDDASTPHDVAIGDAVFRLSAVAEKRGMVAFVCERSEDGGVPDRTTRQRVEREVAKTFYEHLLVFVDAAHTQQVWQWARREPGRPIATREHRYHVAQPGDSLISKLENIAFSIDEEEALTLSRVTEGARRAFDVERITKRFYDRFKTEHAIFLDFIKGIPDEGFQRWYASVMVNRLMFIYFIEKKGFLNDDPNYLGTKLTESKRRGKDRYYREFLWTLFFEGFARKPEERSPEARALLGNVPYLDGGLFLKHQIEEAHGETIRIADEAFEKLFAFFEQYHWHLDERPLRADNEINPDVLGYIFEKYINQKQMGAYYTKPDITGYISRNTVIPRILDIARENCKVAFEPDGSVWRLLREDPDRYIYPAVKHGITVNARIQPGEKPQRLESRYELPPEIAAGVEPLTLHQPVGEGPVLTLELRKPWNKPAPETHALPTEIWREVVARRQRYDEVRGKLERGDVHDANDLITYNLDIEQFARDVVNKCEGPELLRAIWKAIRNLSVLDPTCGSGAFLFAALNILYDLYDDCLDRMELFVEEADGGSLNPDPSPIGGRETNAKRSRDEGKHTSRKYPDFRDVLDQIEKHPNRKYFILKSIILNNLFGVDIMEEAVEICKLRLFLKLVAQVDTPDKIEPLPDIDFNIRAGNTLVGFATYDEVKRAATADRDQLKLGFDDAVMKRIDEKAQDVEMLFGLFREQQTQYGGMVTAADKKEVLDHLRALEDELNRYLAKEYGVAVGDVPTPAYTKWLASHKPFHWFVEFYGIVHEKGGFDVIIGNPPYVEYSKVKDEYAVRGYYTEECGNLYAFVLERCFDLIRKYARFGMIAPISMVAGDAFVPLARVFFKRQSWASFYSNRPGKVFQGVEQRLTIALATNTAGHGYSSDYHHWYEDERQFLLQTLTYVGSQLIASRSMPRKIGNPTAAAISTKMDTNRGSLALFLGSSTKACWFHDGPTYWIRALPFKPLGNLSERSNHYHAVAGTSDNHAFAITSIISSTIFYLHYKLTSNCRDFGAREIHSFGLCTLSARDVSLLANLGINLGERLKRTAKRCSRNYPSGAVEYDEFYPKHSKPILDEIDRVLARHYGFTEEELDFIINYDIKYRMGGELADASSATNRLKADSPEGLAGEAEDEGGEG